MVYSSLPQHIARAPVQTPARTANAGWLLSGKWSGFLRILFMLGTIWVGALLWLHIMHVEFRAEVDMANRMFHEVPGKLSHLKDFATNYRNYLSAEKITHIDSYDPADKHDDDDDTLKSMVQNGAVDDDKSNEVSEANSIAESADADADTAAGATSGTGAEPEDDDTSLDDDNVVKSTIGGEVLALQARLGIAAKFQKEQNAHDEAIHILFSTDCSVFQDWQALVLFHSAHQVGQRGHITRIASGCDAKAQFELVTLYERLWPLSRTNGWVYSVHFPSDFKADVALFTKAYKPFGVQHWLKANAHPALTKTSIHSRSSSGDGSKTTHPLIGNDTIIALIEPDFLFLRPLTTRLRKNPASLYPPEYTTHQQTEMPDFVQKGNPVGQSVHALGSPWAGPENRQKSKKSLRGREGVLNYFDVEYICGKASACSTVTVKDAAKWYAVGPPYIVHIDDFRQIVDAWVLMLPKIQSGSGLPNRIAEMHAYNMAAAHSQLPHTTVLQHLITHVDYSDSEGWKWIDMLGDDVCQPPTENLHAEKKTFYPMSTLPSLLHYHQYYGIGEYGFYKHKFETKYFQCNSPLLVEPPIDIGKTRVVQKAKGTVKVSEINARRNGFMLCTISRVVNDAILDVKVRSCHGGGDSEGNIRDVHDVRAGAFKDTYDVVNRNKTVNLVLSD